jgi:hypothetical protein
MSTEQAFTSFSARKLAQLAGRVQDCLGRLSADQVWWRGGENQNAMGNLVLHLCGNVRQWIIGGVGGAADVRDRDGEFAERRLRPPAEVAALLAQTVAEAVRIIEALPAERLGEGLRIQGYDITVLEAIYSVVEHFGQHTGQIIFLTKLTTGQDLGYYAHLSGVSGRQQVP